MLLLRRGLPCVLVAAACTPGLSAPSTPQLASVADLDAYFAGEGAALSGATAAFDALYQKDPKALAGAVIVYQSDSLQHASPAQPRLISFANDAGDKAPASSTLVVTVAPLDGAGGRLEAFSYDTQAGRFAFAEVSFPAGSAPKLEHDPPRCGACHGVPAKPIWDTYNLWPGVYSGVKEVIRADTAETASFQAFVAAAKTAPAYQHYAFAVTPVPDIENGVLVTGLMPSARDNLQLGLALAYPAYDQAARNTLRTLPSEHKPAMLAIAGRCDLVLTGMPEVLYPPSYLQALGVTSAQISTSVRTHIANNETAKEQRYFQYFGKALPSSIGIEVFDFDLAPIDEGVDSLLNFAALAAGTSGGAWSMEHRPYAYAFQDGYDGVQNLAANLATALLQDPGLAAFKRQFPAENPRGYSAAACNALKDLSLAALEGKPAPQRTLVDAADPLSDDPGVEAPLVRCASCHGSGPSAPYAAAPAIPFDRPADLALALKTDGSGLGAAILGRIAPDASAATRMPPAPYAPLSDAERSAISDYLAYLTSTY